MKYEKKVTTAQSNSEVTIDMRDGGCGVILGIGRGYVDAVDLREIIKVLKKEAKRLEKNTTAY